QANLFKKLYRQTVRFVDDQHCAQPARMTRRQEMTECREQLGLRNVFCQINLELISQLLKEFGCGQEGIEDVRAQRCLAELLKRRSQGCRLAAADFTGDDNQALVVLNAVPDGRQHFKMALGLEYVSRVRCQSKGHLLQTVKLKVHLSYLTLLLRPKRLETPPRWRSD